MNPSCAPTSGLGRIAVVVVHGVGDHKPGASVRAVADLLMDPGDGSSRYSAFTETRLHLPTRRVLVPEATEAAYGGIADSLASAASTSDTFHTFVQQMHSSFAARNTAGSVSSGEVIPEPAGGSEKKTGPAADRLDDAGHFLSLSFLSSYRGEGPGQVFHTRMLSGARLDDAGCPQTLVDLFEMYWSDLSRPRSGVAHLASAFYQLVFHLGSLALRTIDAASLEHRGDPIWKLYGRLQLWTSLTLQLLLGMFYPCLFGLFLVLIGVGVFNKISTGPLRTACVLISGLSLLPASLAYVVSRVRRSVARPEIWTTCFVGGATIGAGAALTTRCIDPFISSREVAIICALLVAISIVPIVSSYRRVRPYADKVALGFGGITFFCLLWELFHFRDDNVNVLRACVATIQAAYDVWAYLLTLLLFLQTACWLIGLCVVFRAPYTSEDIQQDIAGDGDRRAAARERAGLAFRTACLAQTLPIILLTFITSVVVAGLELLAKPLLTDIRYTPPFNWTFLVPNWRLHNDAPPFAYSFLVELHHHLVTPQLVIMIFVMAGVMALLVWALMPLVWCEVLPPSTARRGESEIQAGEFPERETADLAHRLGKWLDFSLHRLGPLRLASLLLFYPVVPLLCMLVIVRSTETQGFFGLDWLAIRIFHSTSFETFVQQRNYSTFDHIQTILSALFLSTAAWVVLFRERLSFLSVGFRTSLNVLLDVDNYMRERPIDANPRARISARYVSLLRHLCRTENQGRKYDAIVIVAHSQGTVITADLLRLLNTQRSALAGAEYQHLDSKSQTASCIDADLEPLGGKIPIYFFTMGCPLRQLYALRFPHLYRWAHHDGADPWLPSNPALIPSNQKPRPDELDVTLWVNTFRSGDYVGRYLWRSPRCSYQWQTPGAPSKERTAAAVSQDALSVEHARRREFCLGAGAHTHYWDKTASLVAAELDQLIELACHRKSWRDAGV